MEELTEEQRKRAEANRLAALAKRKALRESTTNPQRQQLPEQSHQDPWRLFKCRKLSVESTAAEMTHLPKPAQSGSKLPDSDIHLPEKFRVTLQICSPDSFSVTPEPVQGFVYPGEQECLRRLCHCLSDVMPSHYTQNNGGGKACVYKLRDYNEVFASLKNASGIEVEGIPWLTLSVLEKLSPSFVTERWNPCRPEHLSDEAVEEMIGKLPKRISDVLLPFQIEGVRFGLRRGGRCLIADEMGLGKTLQAIAIAGCFTNEGPILVVCPAILRLPWAEELEHWFPLCLPADIHLVFGHRNNPTYLTRFPRVVVISYTMLQRLRKSMTEREWALLIVDESHHVRCSKKRSEPEEVQAVLELAAKVKRVVLLSGTPSLSRPGLLGKSKYDFAKTYCDAKTVKGYRGQLYQDFTKGIRLEELNVLLKQTVMIRRLKEHVLVELPPKRRQIIRLLLKRSDIVSAKAALGMVNGDACETNAAEDTNPESLDESDETGVSRGSGKLSFQELGIAKLSGFRDWLSIHPLIADANGSSDLDLNPNCNKMIIFAHHHKVLDGVQDFICEKGIGFVRIDGTTLPRDRQSAVHTFQLSNEVKIAIIGITAGGVGLDFSAAQNVVFLELPQSPSLMLQAEDRAHRRGQKSAVNIYIFCAKDTLDESHWQNLNMRLRCVSSTTNGKYDALQEIEVEGISYLDTSGETNVNRKDQTLDQLASVDHLEESMKFSDSSAAKGMQSIEATDESTAKLNNKSLDECNTDPTSDETDNHHVEAGRVHDLKMDKDYISRGEVEKKTLLNTKIGVQKDVSSSELDQGNNDEEDHKFNPPTTETDGVGLLPTEADESCSNHVKFLRFEVSQYTGRIHLYICIPGRDLRPRPLFENFRPEELELQDSPSVDDKEKDMESLKGNQEFRDAILEFISDWNMLRPIEQSKLLGKPLQLPLSVELCYLKENINHSSGGLLKGGSKRRTTPSMEISHPLPSNAVWKKVHICSGSRKKEKEYTQGWTENDEPLCKLCQSPCKGDNAKTPEYFEDLFCNLSCYEEYRLRTSGRFLRQELFQIEHGVCVNCKLDCHALVKHIKPLSLERRREYIEKVAPNVARRKNLIEKLVDDPTEGNAWHADHIVPVYLGGGECRLENMRTLCVACHYEVTAAQCAERRSIRAKARKQLKIMLKDLKKDQNVDQTYAYKKDKGGSGKQDKIVESELLVDVPGSSYSGGISTLGSESRELRTSSEGEKLELVDVPGSSCSGGISMLGSESLELKTSSEGEKVGTPMISVHTKHSSG